MKYTRRMSTKESMYEKFIKEGHTSNRKVREHKETTSS